MLDPAVLRLMAITDDLHDGPAGLVERARAAVRGGATMVQLRLKVATAREFVEVARRLVAALPVRAAGPDAIAQVDLGVRAHRHQALRDLSGMATQILAAALARVGVTGAGGAEAAVLRQYLRGLEPVERVVPTLERPAAEAYL